MKKYRVNVNGNTYEIELEEITGAASAPAKPQAPAQTAPASDPAQAPAQGDGEKVVSPLPGNILSVSVKEGDTVKKGDLLMVLEAMKMENEIMAPVSGKVFSLVPKGSAVETGTLLCTIK
ncbi:MAG: biotin/lipoyl-binding protein [Clostridia bacterium]|nr:biotin/lipoyl-binding protein [Clostridia bacterium]